MKKIIAMLVASFFLAASGTVLADSAKPMKTPTAKSMKHKTAGHKAGKKTGKKTKSTATPTGK